MSVKLEKLLFCEHFQPHSRPNLIGLIRSLEFQEFPAKMLSLALVAFLEIDNRDGSADEINFKLLDPDKNEMDVSVPPFNVPQEKDSGVILNLNITNLVFKKEGGYEFQVLLDGELLGSEKIVVSRE